MTKKKIGIGIIGCGKIAACRHIPEYAANENCTIVAFADAVIQRARDLAEQYHGQACEDYNKILENPNIHAISICTANSSHSKIAIAALNAGKHVLCEKPMATSAEEARMMICASSKSDKLLVPAHNQRLISGNKKAKDIIGSGELGQILSINCSFKHKGPESWTIDGSNIWFFKKTAAKVGVLGDLGIHKIDLIHWFTGEKIIFVSANIATLNKRKPNGEFIELEDNATISCTLESGKTAFVDVSWTNYGEEENSSVIYCEKGVIRVNCHKDYDVIVETRDGHLYMYRLSGISTNSNQIKSGIIDDFVNAVLLKSEPASSCFDGYNAAAVLEACIMSHELGSRIRVNTDSQKIICKG